MEDVRAVHPRPLAGTRQRRAATNRWLPLVASVLLATASAANTPFSDLGAPMDRITTEPREELLELVWSDAEDRLQGSIHPAVPREGEPLQVVIQLGSFQGPTFEGPITLTLREEGRLHGKTVTVARGERHWQATFTPETTGLHQLDVSFRTTRYKALHAAFRVESSRVPRMLAWGLLGALSVGLIGYTVRKLLKGERPEERSTALSEEPAPAAAPVPPEAAVPEAPIAITSVAPEGEAPSTPPPSASADPSPVPAAEPENKPPTPQ